MLPIHFNSILIIKPKEIRREEKKSVFPFLGRQCAKATLTIKGQKSVSTCAFTCFETHLQNKDDEIIIPYTCVVLLFIKCFHIYFAIWKDPCHNNPVRSVRYVLLSHFTDEETKAPRGKGVVRSHPGRTPDSWSCGLCTVQPQSCFLFKGSGSEQLREQLL